MTDQWYRGLIPLGYVMGEHLEGNSYSYVVDGEDIQSLLREFQIPMKINRSETFKGIKSLYGLGNAPQLFQHTDFNFSKYKDCLPPVVKKVHYVCSHREICRYEPKNNVTTHIERDNCCLFQFEVRSFVGTRYNLVTFDYGNHLHTCTGTNSHLLRLSKDDKKNIISGVLAHGSVEAYHSNVITAKLESAGSRLRPMDSVRKSDIKRVLKESDVAHVLEAISGDDDITRAKEIIVELSIEQDYHIEFKMPGYECSHENSFVSESIRPLLNKDEAFIFLMSPAQKKVLEKFPDLISADGTHNVLTYSKFKLIVLMASSYTVDGLYSEVGLPIAYVFVTSERGQIHEAIAKVLKMVLPSYNPKVIMSDMAFSALNGFKVVFPDIMSLWCLTHVDKGIRKNVLKTAGTVGVDWARAKEMLSREINRIVCLRDNLTRMEFDRSVDMITSVMLAHGKTHLADVWMTNYANNSVKWAIWSRQQVTNEAFGTGSQIPKMLVTNNMLESFFGHLKHRVLKGSPVTLCKFLSSLAELDLFLKQRLMFCKAWTFVGLFEQAPVQVAQASDVLEHVGFGGDTSDSDSEASIDDDKDREELQVDYEDDITSLLQAEKTNMRLLLDELNELVDSSLRSNLNANQLRTMNKILACAKNSISYMDDSSMSVPIGLLGKLNKNTSPKQVKFGVSKNLLYRAPSAPKKLRYQDDSSATFEDFHSEVLSNTKLAQTIQKSLEELNNTGFTKLFSALMLNTIPRIKAIASELFNFRFSSKWAKETIVRSFLTKLKGLANWPTEVSSRIGDIGVCHQTFLPLSEGEVIFLEINSVRNDGSDCVSFDCQTLSGWTIRSGVIVRIDCVSVSSLKCARLVEKLVDASIV